MVLRGIGCDVEVTVYPRFGVTKLGNPVIVLYSSGVSCLPRTAGAFTYIRIDPKLVRIETHMYVSPHEKSILDRVHPVRSSLMLWRVIGDELGHVLCIPLHSRSIAIVGGWWSSLLLTTSLYAIGKICDAINVV